MSKSQLDVTPYIGKWCKPVEVSYNQRDLIIYALGIGCTDMNFVYENDDSFAAFPTYPIVLAFKGPSQDVVSFPSPVMADTNVTPPLPGTKTGLDGERYIQILKPLPADGATLLFKQRLVSCKNKGKGAAVEIESIITCGKGETVFTRMVSAAFLIGARDHNDAGKSLMPSSKKPDRVPDASDEFVTSPTQTHIYRLSGDYNPLHIDQNFATMFGFKKPILHGLCTMGFAARAVLKRYCANDPNMFKAIKVRFSKPVLPGQTLIVNTWKQGSRILLEVQAKGKKGNSVVVSSAFVDIAEAVAKL